MCRPLSVHCLLLMGALAGFILAGCNSQSAITHDPTPSPVLTPTFTAPVDVNCQPPSPILTVTSPEDLRGAAEVQGSAPGGQLWGLLFPTSGLPLRASSEVKIVWRMTGTGPLMVSNSGPGGITSPLTFGPEEHGSSNYTRPGDEWGTGFKFPIAGCWNIHFTRTDLSGDVWFLVQ